VALTHVWEKRLDKTLYSLVWDQCTDTLRPKLEPHGDYDTFRRDSDGAGLLRIIQDVTYHFPSQKPQWHWDSPDDLHEAERRFYVTCQKYVEQFPNLVDVISHCGETIGYTPAMELLIASQKSGTRKLTIAHCPRI
jgi:hypothetical protein